MHDKPAAVSERTIAQVFDPKRNNFDVLRLAAALLVLFSHSYPLTNTNPEPIYKFTSYDTGGGFAVSAFFVMSGFLVTRSVLGRPGMEYFEARFLRIVPALTIVSIAGMIMGATVTALNLREYLTHPATLATVLNGLVFPISTVLPGVFGGLPQSAWNGSLWTLPLEATCYLLLPVLACFGLVNRYAMLGITLALVTVFVALSRAGFNWDNQGGMLLLNVPLLWSARMGALFFAGGALWLWRDHVKM